VDPTALEREVKLSVPLGFVPPDLTGVLPGAIVRVLPPKRLRATYWDTPDLRLCRAGASLRYREEADGASTWTVKLPTDRSSGSDVLARRELDFGGALGAVPDAASRLVSAYVRTGSLVRVAQLDTRRIRLELRDRRGRPVAEIDDDHVSVMDGRRQTGQFREVEVELAPGAREETADKVVARLQRAGAGDAQSISKVARAIGPRATEPADLALADLAPEASAGELLSACLARSTARLVAHDPGVRMGGDPEDLHQARVATRRLRSDLRTFAPLADPAWVAHLRDEAGWVAGPLGRARDADVLLQRLWGQVAELPSVDMSSASFLLEELAREQERAMADVRSMLDTSRYLSVLDLLVESLRAPALTETGLGPARKVAPALVGGSLRRLRREVKKAGSRPVPGDLHRIRIAAKRCRYATEAASIVMGRPAVRLARQLARVQEVLGEVQDSVVAEARLRDQSQRPLSADQVLVVGELIALERATLRDHMQRWPSTWEEASAKKLRRWLE
jgi:CHAD domain-containing protein